MKKVFLLFGIAAFSSASAQQKDLFDIQKHLQKKQAESKKTDEMNNLVFPIKKPFIPVESYRENKPLVSYTLPNGDMVIISRLADMPCIKPDPSQLYFMPNLAYSGEFNFAPQRPKPGQIPNGLRPYRMIASK